MTRYDNSNFYSEHVFCSILSSVLSCEILKMKFAIKILGTYTVNILLFSKWQIPVIFFYIFIFSIKVQLTLDKNLYNLVLIVAPQWSSF